MMTVQHFVIKQREQHDKLNIYTLLLYLDLIAFIIEGGSNRHL